MNFLNHSPGNNLFIDFIVVPSETSNTIFIVVMTANQKKSEKSS